MSNYVKATNFAAKDGLPSGNPGKIVKGTEIDTEFTAIASAVSSKADLNSPALTGTPTAPTAAAGTNTTQLATTAFVKGEINSLGNMSLQNKNAVDITGGTVAGVTISGLAADLAVADGGTGASSFTLNNLLAGNGTSAFKTIAPGTSGNVLTSNGTEWVSSANDYIGFGQTWQSPTRASDTTYTNSTGKPIMIAVSGVSTGVSAVIVGYVDGVERIAGGTSTSAPAYVAGFSLIIPDGSTYKVSAGNCTLNYWAELR